jgi:hypothetical protein
MREHKLILFCVGKSVVHRCDLWQWGNLYVQFFKRKVDPPYVGKWLSEAQIRGPPPMYHKALFHFHLPVPDVSTLPMTLTCRDELSD